MDFQQVMFAELALQLCMILGMVFNQAMI